MLCNMMLLMATVQLSIRLGSEFSRLRKTLNFMLQNTPKIFFKLFFKSKTLEFFLHKHWEMGKSFLGGRSRDTLFGIGK